MQRLTLILAQQPADGLFHGKMYDVAGLRRVQSAAIEFREWVWQFRRRRDGVWGGWCGEYNSAEAALAALQAEVEADFPAR